MIADFSVRPTNGLIDGETIQIVEGRWPEKVGCGLAVSDKGFDLIEPCLRAACAEWTSGHRYGVFELSPSAIPLLVRLLRGEAERLSSGIASRPETTLVTAVADWLSARSATVPVSILGY